MAVTFPIRLNVADVIAAGRKAYEEGRLSAQGPTPACSYRDKSGLPCVIGAALTDEQAAALDAYEGRANSSLIADLASAGMVDADDIRTLERLQEAHDAWAGGADEAGRRKLAHLLGIEEPA